jgi:8-oxo-dGTP pyrophosphatase MutT (NUDIX family)
LTKKFWSTSGRDIVFETPVLSLRRDRKQRPTEPPGSGDSRDFFVIEAVDWVNVIPWTEDDEVVFIDHYRHGIDGISLEVPGGMIDPEDASPMVAAAREMREETGYAAQELVELGVVHPNPAIQENRCFTFLAKNARLVGEPQPDDTEDIDVVRYPRRDIPGLLRDGKISHALVVAALFWWFQYEEKL